MSERNWILILACIAIAALVWWTDNRSKPEPEIIFRTDTVRETRIIRDTIVETERRVFWKIDTVPVYLPGDTQKVAVMLPFEQKKFRGENYEATVSGYKPYLESINIFQKKETITNYQTKTMIRAPVWQVGAVFGAQGSRGWHNEYAGIRARFNQGRFSFETTVGYNPWSNAPYGEARVGFDFIRK